MNSSKIMTRADRIRIAPRSRSALRDIMLRRVEQRVTPIYRQDSLQSVVLECAFMHLTDTGNAGLAAAVVAFIGISILIAVGVSLETMKQIDSQLMMRNY
ncbi:MAG: hypothetical protein HKN37_12325 [Rhodothermales bacterium]|nr:hypothetical protein [Rhodothermales bacterium]